MATLSREKVIDQWFALVERGAGRDTWVMDKTQEAISAPFPPFGALWATSGEHDGPMPFRSRLPSDSTLPENRPSLG